MNENEWKLKDTHIGYFKIFNKCRRFFNAVAVTSYPHTKLFVRIIVNVKYVRVKIYVIIRYEACEYLRVGKFVTWPHYCAFSWPESLIPQNNY
jgi:hypothetical protein